MIFFFDPLFDLFFDPFLFFLTSIVLTLAVTLVNFIIVNNYVA